MGGLLQKLSLAFLLATEATSKPISAPKPQVLGPRAGLNVVKTTTTDTHTIDWIAIDSQGTIASAPPLPPRGTTRNNGTKPMSELMHPDAELGPPGTVPIPRVNANLQARSNRATKQPPPTDSAQKRATTDYKGRHWYVTSKSIVANLGGSAAFSMFAPYLQDPEDFSLLEISVAKAIQLSKDKSGLQTVEAGWINYPSQVSKPHLFSFFTTNNYESIGNYKGGYNNDHIGWVQSHNKYYPGAVFPTLSVEGGAQQEIHIQYHMHEGNWWLGVHDAWIGYYPGSLFSDAHADASLAAGADIIQFYGEVTNGPSALTTSDMGSGQFADAGMGKAAYIHNMVYEDFSSGMHDYTGDFGKDGDATRYSHDAHLSSGTNLGSYVFIGGPGAGGVVGG